MALPTTTVYRDSAGRTREEFEPPFSSDAEDYALRNERAFFASTSMIDVQQGQALYVILTNPANSGKWLFSDERWFDNNRGSGGVPLEYTSFVNPTAILTSTAPRANRKLGGAAGVGVMTFQAGSEIAMGGIQASAAPLPTGGLRQIIDLPLVIGPGGSLGFRFDGGGQNLQQAARVGASFIWHEEDI